MNDNCVKYQLKLGDQAPRIGSGYRRVTLISRGPKWTWVRYWPAGPKGYPIRHKFHNDAFEKCVVGGPFMTHTHQWEGDTNAT